MAEASFGWEPTHQDPVHPHHAPQTYVAPRNVLKGGAAHSYTYPLEERAIVSHDAHPGWYSQQGCGDRRQFHTDMSPTTIPLETDGGNQAALPQFYLTEGYLDLEHDQRALAYPYHAPRSYVVLVRFPNNSVAHPFTFQRSIDTQTCPPEEEAAMHHDVVPARYSWRGQDDGRQFGADMPLPRALLENDRNQATHSEAFWSSDQMERTTSTGYGVTSQ